MLISCYQLARDAGHIPASTDPAMSTFLSGSYARMSFDIQKTVNADVFKAADQISQIVQAINAARASGVAWIEKTQPEALQVAVVSMPERTTSTLVQRDPQNTIIGSMQIERDA